MRKSWLVSRRATTSWQASNVKRWGAVSNFTSTLDIIEAHCKEEKYSWCRLDGRAWFRIRFG